MEWMGGYRYCYCYGVEWVVGRQQGVESVYTMYVCMSEIDVNVGSALQCDAVMVCYGIVYLAEQRRVKSEEWMRKELIREWRRR